MILPDHMIRDLAPDPDHPGRRVVEPFCERMVFNGLSYGLSCAGYDVRTREAAVLRSGGFVLLSTLEHFWMPNDVLARVCDKSTWARRGICVQTTVIEPGWRGWLTVEVSNHGTETVEISAGDPIAQILFERMAAPPERAYAGKYQDQPPHPVEARFEPHSTSFRVSAAHTTASEHAV